jgi:4-hydroxy-3-methylbut-2-enyl diphosphate reductase
MEARRYSHAGYDVLIIGHAGHVEVQGTVGHVTGRAVVIETLEDAYRVEVADPSRVAILTQTTLCSDIARDLTSALLRRFPAAKVPRKEDICYATHNRQAAVKAIAKMTDLILVLGDVNSSNSQRLLETARSCGVPAYLISGSHQLMQPWLTNISTVGIAAGASTPESIIEMVINTLRHEGFSEIVEVSVGAEYVTFPLPLSLTSRALERPFQDTSPDR